MYAARWGHYRCMDALIKARADVNVHNYIDYSTALTHVAYSYPDSFEEDGYFDTIPQGHGDKKNLKKEMVEKCIALFILAGADLNAVNVKGHTALTAAIMVGNFDCVCGRNFRK